MNRNDCSYFISLLIIRICSNNFFFLNEFFEVEYFSMLINLFILLSLLIAINIFVSNLCASTFPKSQIFFRFIQNIDSWGVTYHFNFNKTSHWKFWNSNNQSCLFYKFKILSYKLTKLRNVCILRHKDQCTFAKIFPGETIILLSWWFANFSQNLIVIPFDLMILSNNTIWINQSKSRWI